LIINLQEITEYFAQPKLCRQADPGQLHGFVLGRLATLAAWHALLGLPTPYAAPAVAGLAMGWQNCQTFERKVW